MKEVAALAVLTGFGAGYAPVAPGTFGSAVGVGIHWAVAFAPGGGEWLVPPVAVAFFAATWALGGIAVRRFGSKDPQRVVSDEVAGYLVSVAWTAGTGAGFWTRAVLGFLLFRVFDVVKPWPIRRFESLPGGLGIAADDVVAGVFANLALRAGVLLGARLGW